MGNSASGVTHQLVFPVQTLFGVDDEAMAQVDILWSRLIRAYDTSWRHQSIPYQGSA